MIAWNEQRHSNRLDRRVTPASVVDPSAPVDVVRQARVLLRRPDRHGRYLEVGVVDFGALPCRVEFRGIEATSTNVRVRRFLEVGVVDLGAFPRDIKFRLHRVSKNKPLLFLIAP